MELNHNLIYELNSNSLYKTLGIKIEESGNGKTKSRLTPNPDVCWPFPDQPHGGILFTQMDTTMAWAALSTSESNNCSTVNLDIQYPAPAKGKFFICSARVVHQTKRTSFVRADIRDPEGQIVAMGHATFRVFQL